MQTHKNKVQLTVLIDPETRELFEKYGGRRSIGQLLQKLIRQHDAEETYGQRQVAQRLDRIDARMLELLDGKTSVPTFHE